jgi:hypothetical protein
MLPVYIFICIQINWIYFTKKSSSVTMLLLDVTETYIVKATYSLLSSLKFRLQNNCIWAGSATRIHINFCAENINCFQLLWEFLQYYFT